MKKANNVQGTIVNLIQRSKEARRDNSNDGDEDEEGESDNENESHATENIIVNPEASPTSPADKVKF